MILYIDETEYDEYFIVAGLLVDSKEKIDLVYKRFKKKLKGLKLSDKSKQQLFLEFKAVLLDRNFQKIKIKMLQELNQINYCTIFSCYVKKDKVFKQEDKEKNYILLLEKIVKSIDIEVSIIFDTFNKKDFENDIVECLSHYKNVLSIKPMDSRKEAGLQFIDNICSVIRLHKMGGSNPFYELVQDYLKEV